MKEHPIIFSAPMIRAILDGRKSMTRRVAHIDGMARFSGCDKPEPYKMVKGMPVYVKVRYKKGDLLWAKETWAIVKDDDDRDRRIYKADGVIGSAAYRGVDFGTRTYYGPWKSSIFMPRRESRITLEVTADERIERLRDITEWDAYNEGFNEIGEFFAFWDSLNAGRGYPVKSNPWVRVIAFRRIKP